CCKEGLPEPAPASFGRASARACISPPGGGKKAYTIKIKASVRRPAVRKKSANFWWVIFCQAPKITTAAPMQTMMFTSFSVDFETPADIVLSFLVFNRFCKGLGNGVPIDVKESKR